MKIGIIGVGSVGGAVASQIVSQNLAKEIVLIDTDLQRALSAALDLSHAATFFGDTKIIAGKYKDLVGSEIVIIAAGANQKINQSRTELIECNAEVMIDIVPGIMQFVDKKKIILIVVTNPLDSMVTAIQKISKLPANRVIGTGTMLDTSRLKYELAKHFEISAKIINAYVLGEHGDTSFVNWDSSNIGGFSINEFAKQTRFPFTQKMQSEIESRIHGAAMEIIKGRGATWDGIAAATSELVRSIKNDEHKILPTSIVEKNIAYSMPRIVGKDGVISSLSPKLSAQERTSLNASITAIKKTYNIIK